MTFMRSRFVLLGIVACLSLSLSACALLGQRNSANIRYRETITYQIGGQTLTATGVYEAVYIAEDSLSRGNRVNTYVYGAAIPLPNPAGRSLFVLIRYPFLPDEQGISQLTDACGLDVRRFRGNNYHEQFVSAVKNLPNSCEAPKQAWPFIVEVGEKSSTGKRPVKYVTSSGLVTSFRIERTTDDVTYPADTAVFREIVGAKIKVPGLKYNGGHVDVYQQDVSRGAP